MNKFQIDPSKVKKIYVGRDKVCRCGCKGVYHEPGSRGFKMALNRLAKLSLDDVLDVSSCDMYVDVSLENDRAITFYFETSLS